MGGAPDPATPARRADKSRTQTALTFGADTECQVPTRTAKFWEEESDPGEAAAVPTETHSRGGGKGGESALPAGASGTYGILTWPAPSPRRHWHLRFTGERSKTLRSSSELREDSAGVPNLSNTKPLPLALLYLARVGVCRSDPSTLQSTRLPNFGEALPARRRVQEVAVRGRAGREGWGWGNAETASRAERPAGTFRARRARPSSRRPH